MRLCFFFEYKNIVGGVTSLLITLIEELCKRDHPVLLVNFKDGLIANELSKLGVNPPIEDFNAFRKGELKHIFSENDVCIITSFKEVYYQLFAINPRILYFNVDGRLAQAASYKFGMQRKSASEKLVIELIEKKTLLLMDDTGVNDMLREFNYTIKNPIFAPIPVKVPRNNNYRNDLGNKILRIAYVGRAVDWKITPLKKLLDDIKSFPSEVRSSIKVTILVDNIDNLKLLLPLNDYVQNGISISIYEKVPPTELQAFLLDKADILFAMGTAALDGAKYGIPTLLADYSKQPFPKEYRYIWMYETKCYSLGHNLLDGTRDLSAGVSLREVVEMSFDSKFYLKEQSRLCYEYVLTKHSVGNVVNELINAAKGSAFRIKDAKEYILYYSWFHQSIKKLSSLFHSV